MRIALPLLALVALTGAPTLASAQVLVLGGDYEGELSESDVGRFRDAFLAGLERGAPGEVVPQQDTEQAVGTLVECRGGDCAIAIGFAVSASVAVASQVYAEAEIYDFTVRVFDLNTGETLVTQTGDCTFCPIAEALDAFAFTAEAAIGAVGTMPEPSPGPTPAPEEPTIDPLPEPVAEPTPEPEPEPEPEPVPPAPAFATGDIGFDVSAVPDTSTISINGEPVGTGRVRLDLAAQDLLVEFAAAGHEPHSEDVSLRDSMTGPIYLRVVLSPTVQLVQTPTQRQPRADDTSSPDHRALGGVLLGTGIAAAAGGIVLLALDGDTTCTNGPASLCEEVWEFTPGGAALTAVGGISVGTGIGLLVSSLRRGGADQAAHAPRLGLAPQRRGAAFVLSGTF